MVRVPNKGHGSSTTKVLVKGSALVKGIVIPYTNSALKHVVQKLKVVIDVDVFGLNVAV